MLLMGKGKFAFSPCNMPSQNIYAAEPAKGWKSWGALVPFLGIIFVAATVVSLTPVLQQAHLVDAHLHPPSLYKTLPIPSVTAKARK